MRPLRTTLLSGVLLIPLAACYNTDTVTSLDVAAPTTSTATTSAAPTSSSASSSAVPLPTSSSAAPTGTPAPVAGESPYALGTWERPGSADSLWNTAISQQAQYAPAGITPSAHHFETNWLYTTTAGDPRTTARPPGSWTDRCSVNSALGTSQPDPSLTGDFAIPTGFAEKAPPPVDGIHTPNNAAAVLQPDGSTVVNLHPLQSCPGDNQVVGWRVGDVQLDSADPYGAHLGSGLSALSGTLRTWELQGTGPITHALQAMLDEKQYYTCADGSCHRWPAYTADAGAESFYGGTNDQFTMGSLLALPPTVDLAALGVTDPTAVRVCTALRDYGTYVVDAAGWDAHYLSYEQGAAEAAGLTGNDAYRAQVDSCFTALSIVTNNAEGAPGGGPAGAPRLVG